MITGKSIYARRTYVSLPNLRIEGEADGVADTRGRSPTVEAEARLLRFAAQSAREQPGLAPRRSRSAGPPAGQPATVTS